MKFTRYTTILGVLVVVASYVSLQFLIAIIGFSIIGIGYLVAACIRWKSDWKIRDKSLSLASTYLLLNIPFSLYIGVALWLENPELFVAVWAILQVWFLVGCIGVYGLWFPKSEPDAETLNKPSPWTTSL